MKDNQIIMGLFLKCSPPFPVNCGAKTFKTSFFFLDVQLQILLVQNIWS